MMPRRLHLSTRVWALAAGAATGGLPRETGGLLLGHYGPAGLCVTDAIVVPDPRATRIRYRRDAAAAARILRDQMRSDTTGLLGYLGEWHSHPLPVGPSELDRRAALWLAAEGGHEVALLVLALGPRGWTGHARAATPDGSFHTTDLRTEGTCECPMT